MTKRELCSSGDALRAPDPAPSSTTFNSTILVIALLLSGVLLRLQGHNALRKVPNARVAHNVDRLVRLLRDVVRAYAEELDQHVVDRALQRALDVRADLGYRWGSWVVLLILGMVWVRPGGWNGVDSYLPSASISLLIAALRYLYRA
jgi:hypothetical protein